MFALILLISTYDTVIYDAVIYITKSVSWNSHRWTSLCNLKLQNNRSLWRGPHYTRYTISRDISTSIRCYLSKNRTFAHSSHTYFQNIRANYILIILNIIIVIQLITNLNPLLPCVVMGETKHLIGVALIVKCFNSYWWSLLSEGVVEIAWFP